MIVKDEEEVLLTALASFASLGDLLADVCIYDTGSTDGTVQLARQWGARVERGYWDDDFSRARNAAFDMVDTPWALVVDADEQVIAQPDHIRRYMERLTQTQAYACRIEVADVREGLVASTAPSVRLVKPSEVRYHNRIHENVRRRADGSVTTSNAVPREAVRLEHRGYGVQSKDAVRGPRNRRIGELEVEALRAQGADADRLAQALFDLGRSRAYCGDSVGALASWHEAWAMATSSPFRLQAGRRLVEAGLAASPSSDLVALQHIVDELRAVDAPSAHTAWLQAELYRVRGETALAYSILRSLERPVTDLGEDRFIRPVLRSRCLCALALGEVEDALTTALTLVVGHDEIENFARPIVLTWGSRPASVLVEILGDLSVDQRIRFARSVSEVPGARGICTLLLAATATAEKSR